MSDNLIEEGKKKHKEMYIMRNYYYFLHKDKQDHVFQPDYIHYQKDEK